MKPETHRQLILAAQASGHKHLGDWLGTLKDSGVKKDSGFADAERIAGSTEDFVRLCDHAACALERLFEVLDHQPKQSRGNLEAYRLLDTQYRKTAKLARSVGLG